MVVRILCAHKTLLPSLAPNGIHPITDREISASSYLPLTLFKAKVITRSIQKKIQLLGRIQQHGGFDEATPVKLLFLLDTSKFLNLPWGELDFHGGKLLFFPDYFAMGIID